MLQSRELCRQQLPTSSSRSCRRIVLCSKSTQDQSYRQCKLFRLSFVRIAEGPLLLHCSVANSSNKPFRRCVSGRLTGSSLGPHELKAFSFLFWCGLSSFVVLE